MDKPRILLVDNDPEYLTRASSALASHGAIAQASTVADAMQMLKIEHYDIAIIDLKYRDDPRGGLSLYKDIKALYSNIGIIFVSAENNIDKILEAFSFGATRFVQKSKFEQTIRAEVKELLLEIMSRKELFSNTSDGGKEFPLNPLLGSSRAISKVRSESSWMVSAGVRDILIQGETGTGKEKLARYLAHLINPNEKFIPVHCGAISEGLTESELFGHMKGSFTGAEKDRIGVFEAANGGFVFLDEIGEMPLIQQTKLLRVIQERVVQRVGTFEEKKANFRAIYATNLELETAVKEKKFREDLFYRIAKHVITLPPLRDRKEDIGLLLNSFELINSRNEKISFTEDTVEALKTYSWPGNIRQLRHVAERLSLQMTEPVVRLAHLYKFMPDFAISEATTAGPLAIQQNRRQKIEFVAAIERAEGNRDLAAKDLGLSRATFFRRAKILGISKRKLRDI